MAQLFDQLPTSINRMIQGQAGSQKYYIDGRLFLTSGDVLATLAGKAKGGRGSAEGPADHIQLKARPVSAAASKPVPKTRPTDVLDVLQKTGEKEALKVCNLKLVYSSFGSESSYLQVCAGPSEYVLYDDDTVEYVNSNSDAMKCLSGWLSDGLFYLFNPVLNGKEIDVTTTSQLTSSYYQAGSTKRRAKVRQINGGDYKCAGKGTVVMNVV